VCEEAPATISAFVPFARGFPKHAATAEWLSAAPRSHAVSYGIVMNGRRFRSASSARGTSHTSLSPASIRCDHVFVMVIIPAIVTEAWR